MNDMTFDKMKAQVDAFFANLTKEDFVASLQKADYDYYKDVKASVFRNRLIMRQEQIVPIEIALFHRGDMLMHFIEYTKPTSCFADSGIPDDYAYAVAA